MAVGLKPPEQLVAIDGLRLASAEAGIRYQDRDDMLLMALTEGATTAAVFTQNKYCAAPVIVAKQHLQKLNLELCLLMPVTPMRYRGNRV